MAVASKNPSAEIGGVQLHRRRRCPAGMGQISSGAEAEHRDGPWASNGVEAQVCLPSSIKHKRHSAVAPYLTEKFRQSSTKGHAAIAPHLTEKFRGGRAATAAAAPVSHRTGQGAVLFDLCQPPQYILYVHLPIQIRLAPFLFCPALLLILFNLSLQR